jgi:glycosyltransferase involved in cell wall biosynthesis
LDRSRLAIIIPAFNEEATIAKVVENCLRYGCPCVVDDGSIDDTALNARSAGAFVITHEVNSGYDCALNSGFSYAASSGFDFIITLDADGQHDAELIEKFITAFDDGADLVLGVRSKHQRFAETLFALYTRARFGIRDPLCGMKGYRTSMYNIAGSFDTYSSIGTELMLRSAVTGCRIYQCDFEALNRQGQAKFGVGLAPNLKILRAMAKGICHSVVPRRSTRV